MGIGVISSCMSEPEENIGPERRLLEGAYFNKMAEKNDVKGAKFISHEEFWAQVLQSR